MGGIIQITAGLLNSYIHGTTNKKPTDMLKDEIPCFIQYTKFAKPQLVAFYSGRLRQYQFLLNLRYKIPNYC